MLGKSFVTLQVLLDPNFPGQAYLPVQITEVPFFEGWYHFTFVRYHMVPAEILDWEGVEEGNPGNLEKMRRFLSHWIIVSKHMNLSRWLYYAPMGSISSTYIKPFYLATIPMIPTPNKDAFNINTISLKEPILTLVFNAFAKGWIPTSTQNHRGDIYGIYSLDITIT